MAIPDLNQLRTFVVLYELRSLTATAEFLHVTQPTVSYTLARLRERFGDDLFLHEYCFSRCHMFELPLLAGWVTLYES